MLIGMVLAACSFVPIYSTAPTLGVVEHTSYAVFAVEQNQLRTDDDDDDGCIIVSLREHHCTNPPNDNATEPRVSHV